MSSNLNADNRKYIFWFVVEGSTMIAIIYSNICFYSATITIDIITYSLINHQCRMCHVLDMNQHIIESRIIRSNFLLSYFVIYWLNMTCSVFHFFFALNIFQFLCLIHQHIILLHGRTWFTNKYCARYATGSRIEIWMFSVHQVSSDLLVYSSFMK